MKKTDYGFLFLVSLAFFSVLATLQKVPGYMDAEYYFGQSLRIAQHHDFLEPFIWNYLNNSSSVSVPGFTFWLPMTSFAAASGLWISGSSSFYGSKILFILMAGAITVMAAFLANSFFPGKRAGWLAGLLAMFSGFYLPFITITDTFTPYMFFGGLFFVCGRMAEVRSKTSEKPDYWFLVIGTIAGLMSLTRSDGILWLAGGWLSVIAINGFSQKNWKKTIINTLMLLIGFSVVMIPWYSRNIGLFQTLYPSGNGLMPLLTKYDDLFVYPSNALTFSRWLESGFGNIIWDRLKALGSNLQTLVASGGAIVLAPIMLVGLWKTRKSTLTRLTLVMILGILAIMTIIFPYAGVRGGFFHSLSAVQVVLWSVVPLGLETIIEFGVKRRKWKTERSWKMFGPSLVVVVGIISAVIFAEKLTKGTESGIPWNETQDAFKAIELGIRSQTDDQVGVIMVNDPPGFTLATGRPSVMIPSGNPEALIEVSNHYEVRYLAINGERADFMMDLKQNKLLMEHFKFLFEAAGNSVYEFNP
ncbi:MAG: hypothetical protein C0410_14465 [Anaerolinea sp.]|nr:hypothetical protein [Anaerolinea sp.]